jgi:hypothetical protein
MRVSGLALAVVLLASRDAFACAIAPPESEHVRMEAEEALIVWDAKAGVEHFIRRAAFETASKDFGFLVPTPSKPTLAEADDAVFARLEEHTKPEVVTKRSYEVEPGGFLLRSKSEAAAGLDGVNVLDVARVAGLDAVVLEADDASALGEWLKKHGYAFPDELLGWVEPYVKKHWKITAFKIARGADGGAFGTRALRMSFETKEPFFPYREPATAGAPRGPARMLRVSIVSTERVDGSFESGGVFPGKAVWAGPLTNAQGLLAGAVAPGSLPTEARLTVIEDSSNPRPGHADVWFRRAADQSELRRPPRIVHDVVAIPIPLELLALFSCFGLGIGAFFVLRRLRRSGSR